MRVLASAIIGAIFFPALASAKPLPPVLVDAKSEKLARVKSNAQQKPMGAVVSVVGDLDHPDNQATFTSTAAVPLTIFMRDMDSSWKRVRVGGSFGLYGAANGDTILFTRGKLVNLNGEDYLAVYEIAPIETAKLSPWQYRATQMQASNFKLRPETLLVLSLWRQKSFMENVKIGDIEPFNVSMLEASFNDSEMHGSYFNIMSLKYLRKINDALTRYKTDFEYSTMPPMTTPEAARRALSPYAENAAIFVQPGTNNLYVPNPILSERKLLHLRYKVKKSWRVLPYVMFYEKETAPDGSRGVLMMDGSARRVDDETWQALKKQSKIGVEDEVVSDK